uniref:Uncharacterized protein n=1 Tax=Anguilla anguilla TaxID=7936 RepID=A0A0E9TNX0_ANGAN
MESGLIQDDNAPIHRVTRGH